MLLNCGAVCGGGVREGIMPFAQLSPHFQETGSFNHHHNPSRLLQPEVLRFCFPSAGTLGCTVYLVPQLLLPFHLHMNVGLPDLPAVISPAWSTSHHLAVCPLHPGCPSLPLLPVWMNVSSVTPWLSNFLTVLFSGSSGCFLFVNWLFPCLVV